MSEEVDDTLRDDYDFSNGVRGKYRHLRGQPHTIKIRHPDGSVTLETVEAATEIDPDVRSYFLGSGAVNRALRGLMELIPEKQGKRQQQSVRSAAD